VSTQTQWEDILEEGETILWQGRPTNGIRLSDFISFNLPFGLVFAAFAAFWITTSAAMTGNAGMGFDLFPLFGVPFLLVGLYLAVGVPFWDAYERSNSWYTLTDRGAYIATELFGRRKLVRTSVADMNALELEDGPEGTVWFRKEFRVHTSTRRSRSGLPSRSTHTSMIRLGFKRITEVRKVYRLVAQLISQRDSVQPPA